MCQIHDDTTVTHCTYVHARTRAHRPSPSPSVPHNVNVQDPRQIPTKTESLREEKVDEVEEEEGIVGWDGLGDLLASGNEIYRLSKVINEIITSSTDVGSPNKNDTWASTDGIYGTDGIEGSTLFSVDLLCAGPMGRSTGDNAGRDMPLMPLIEC